MFEIFVAVALLMTPAGPKAVAFEQAFPTLKACDEWRENANKQLPAGSVIASKCVALGVAV